MITFVCCRWTPRPGYRSRFPAATVNTLQRMVARHYRKPHRFVCFTDDPAGIEAETLPMWDDHAGLKNASWPDGPSAYRRLRLFSREMKPLLGERIVSLDLDVVILRDLEPLLDRPDDFVGYRCTNPAWRYNGSMWMLRTGSRPHVWEDFDPDVSPQLALEHGARGSDQAWISYCLPNEPTWGPEDGCYGFQDELIGKGLPSNARVVMFYGRFDPWEADARGVAPWIRRFYR